MDRIKKWAAYGSKRTHIGTFVEELDAHHAYLDVLENGIQQISKYRRW